MTYKINGSDISSEDKDNVMIVAFGDDKYEPARFIIIQGSHEYDEQDRNLGMDTVYIEMSDNLQPDYGYIESFILSGNNLSIQLKRETSEKLGIDAEILIDLTGDETEKSKAISMLKYISGIEGIKFVEQAQK